MPIDFYYVDLSPPCRAVMLTARALGIDLNLKLVDLMAGEHLKPEYIKMNPQHNVPFMVDGLVKIGESRAICTYLVSQYGKDDELYPKNPRARCIVDQRLYFDMGTLYQRWADFAYPVFQGKPADHTKMEKLQEALALFDSYLAEFTWAAGNKMTVADFSLAASVSSMVACGVDIDDYDRVEAWLERCQKKMVGYAEANEKGAQDMAAVLKDKLFPKEDEEKE